MISRAKILGLLTAATIMLISLLVFQARVLMPAAGGRFGAGRLPFPEARVLPQLIEKVMPTIVDISAENQAVYQGQPVLTRNPKTNQPVVLRPLRGVKSTKQGAGVIIDKSGRILTNAHVVEGMKRVRVIFFDGSETDGEVVSTEPNYDIAIIQVEIDSPLPVLSFGDSDLLMVGEEIVAVGNPHGLRHSVSKGVISAKDRDIVWKDKDLIYEGLLQTDINLNIGNSGGPLINGKGELIGLNLAAPIGTRGISFAIPINTVKRVYQVYAENA